MTRGGGMTGEMDGRKRKERRQSGGIEEEGMKDNGKGE